MKIGLYIRRCITLILPVLICWPLIIGCTDTTGSAGAVAVFDGNSRCRYCNAKITNDDIDKLNEHGNGVCAPEIDFIDSATHLCNYCGKPYVYNAQNSHGKNVCVYNCAGATGHRVPAAGNHSSCEICGDWLCINTHGEGICGTSQSTEESSSETTSASPESVSLGKTKSSDNTLRIFSATFPNGTVIDMRTIAARQNIVVTAQDSVTVKTTASHSKATVSGDKGTLKLSLGANNFCVTVTSEDSTIAYFYFTITVKSDKPVTIPVETTRPSATKIPTTTPTTPPTLKPATPPTFNPTVDKIVCPKCQNNVKSIKDHLKNCGHYSCDDSFQSQEGNNHDPAICGESGHYSCDGKDHYISYCNNASHHCGDGMTHLYCPIPNCTGTLCDNDHYGKTCPLSTN